MVTIDFDKIFLMIDVIELGGTAFFGWLLVWHFEYGVIGIGIARFIVILISAVVCIVAWKMQGMKESFKKEETFAEIYLSKGFWEFSKFFLKNTAPGYGEYLGYEAITIMIGIIGDEEVLTAWVSFQSIVACVYLLGMGFADITRSFVGFQIGKRNLKFAKKLGVWSIIMNILG